jgi:hypothetical protein
MLPPSDREVSGKFARNLPSKGPTRTPKLLWLLLERAMRSLVAALWAESGEMSLDGEAIAAGREQVEAKYAEYFEQNPGATFIYLRRFGCSPVTRHKK